MPKIFSEEEKEIIRDILIKKGHKLFSAYGLKKTNVAELAKSAGIAQGTFYKFFDSKEELYFCILESEQTKSEQYFIDIVKSSSSVEEAFKRIITGIFELLQTNSILRNLMENNDYKIIVRKLTQDKLESHMVDDSIRINKIIELVQEKWGILNIQPKVIAGLLRTVAVLALHQKEIGNDIYPEIIEMLANLIAVDLAKMM